METSQINTWPGWTCVRQLGAGSFGKVYEISREDSGNTYTAALKVITIPQDQAEVRSAYSEGMDEQSATAYYQSVVKSITDECALMSGLKGNTNIVSYEDHMVVPHGDNSIGWDILIRMELLQPILDYQKTHSFTDEDVIRLGTDMCTALELCERRSIIHRDIKPENIFVNADGNFKLGDFGISRTMERTVSNMSKKGTYSYMAPEVYKGMPYGATADIYSLGMVLYRYLNNNRTAFLPQGTIRYEDRMDALERRINGEAVPEPANGSPALKQVVMKALAYEPEKRFQSAEAFKKALLTLHIEPEPEQSQPGGTMMVQHPSPAGQPAAPVTPYPQPAPVQTPVPPAPAPAAPKKKPILLWSLCGVLVVAIAGMAYVLLTILGVFNKADPIEAARREAIELGRQYLEQGQYEDAVNSFTDAIVLDDSDPDAYAQRADALYQWGISMSEESDDGTVSLPDEARNKIADAARDYATVDKMDPDALTKDSVGNEPSTVFDLAGQITDDQAERDRYQDLSEKYEKPEPTKPPEKETGETIAPQAPGSQEEQSTGEEAAVIPTEAPGENGDAPGETSGGELTETLEEGILEAEPTPTPMLETVPEDKPTAAGDETDVYLLTASTCTLLDTDGSAISDVTTDYYYQNGQKVLAAGSDGQNTFYEYDGSGRLTLEVTDSGSDGDERYACTAYEYNDSGRLSSTTSWTTGETGFTVPEDGTETEYFYYYDSGDISYSERFGDDYAMCLYDEPGNLVSVSYVIGAGETYENEYDDAGNLTVVRAYKGGAAVSVTTNTYVPAGEYTAPELPDVYDPLNADTAPEGGEGTTGDAPGNESEDVVPDIPEDVPENVPEYTPEETPEYTPEDVPEEAPDDTPEYTPEYTPEDVPEEAPEDVPENEPEDVVPEDVFEDVPADEPEDVPEDTYPEDEVIPGEPDDGSEDEYADSPEGASVPTEQETTPDDSETFSEGGTEDWAAYVEPAYEEPVYEEPVYEEPVDEGPSAYAMYCYPSGPSGLSAMELDLYGDQSYEMWVGSDYVSGYYELLTNGNGDTAIYCSPYSDSSAVQSPLGGSDLCLVQSDGGSWVMGASLSGGDDTAYYFDPDYSSSFPISSQTGSSADLSGYTGEWFSSSDGAVSDLYINGTGGGALYFDLYGSDISISSGTAVMCSSDQAAGLVSVNGDLVYVAFRFSSDGVTVGVYPAGYGSGDTVLFDTRA